MKLWSLSRLLSKKEKCYQLVFGNITLALPCFLWCFLEYFYFSILSTRCVSFWDKDSGKERKRCQCVENYSCQDRIGYVGANIRPQIAIGLTQWRLVSCFESPAWVGHPTLSWNHTFRKTRCPRLLCQRKAMRRKQLATLAWGTPHFYSQPTGQS